MSEKFNYGMSLEPYNIKSAMRAAKRLLFTMDHQQFVDDPRSFDVKKEYRKHVCEKYT